MSQPGSVRAGATCTWTNTSKNGLWASSTNWSCSAVPTSVDDVIFNNTTSTACTLDVSASGVTVKSLLLDTGFTGSLTIKRTDSSGIGSFTATGDITVTSGNIILQGNSSAIGDGSAGSPYGLGIVLNAVNVNIGASGTINSDGKGFAAGAGPGHSVRSVNDGGAYGGRGGAWNGSVAYGTVNNPTALGSGGGTGGGNAGGGAIKIVASGIVTVNGRLSSNSPNSGNNYGTGSGGSIWVIASSLTGNGTISANSGTNGDYGTGGGGRIDISQAPYNFMGTIQVNGAVSTGGVAYGGQTGSILFPTAADVSFSNKTVKFNNCNAFGALTLTSSTVTFERSVSDVSLCTMSAGSVVVGTTSTLNIYRNNSETDDAINLGSITVNSGGNIVAYGSTTLINTQAGGSIGTPYGRGVVIGATSVTVDVGGSINADGTGFSAQTGPGKGATNYGASYGGAGNGTSGSPTYGSSTGPTALGSGGRSVSGGGALKIVASGVVTVNGRVSANGAIASGNGYSGGSGGSLWIIAGSLAGSGTISANGGNISSGGTGSGGGRVDISQVVYNFSGSVSALPSSGNSPSGKTGSILFGGNVTFTNKVVQFNNCSSFGALTLTSSTVTFERNASDIAVCTMSATSVTVGSTSTLNIYRNNSETDDTYNLGAITVNNGGNIIAFSSTTIINADAGGSVGNPFGKGIAINATDVTVDVGGSINANAQGFARGTGPGHGNGGGSTGSSGGGYGGIGGRSGGATPGASGSTYGNAYNPTALGSGGSAGGGGAGGGAIKIVASGTVTVNGTISANGGNSGTNHSAGSGGSLWIQADVLAGSGTISANGGGSGSSGAAAGGGGRLLYSYSSKTFSGTLTASVGTSVDIVTPAGVGSIRGSALYGELISSVYDAQDAHVMIGDISWTATTSTNTSIKFQIRTSPDGNTWTDWLGPTGTSTFYTSASGGNSINASSSDKVNDRYFQYKAILTSNTLNETPTLQSVNVTYVVNATPQFQSAVTASQNLVDGQVNITYRVADPDTRSTGVACPNCIIPSFEYSIDNGQNWNPITAGLSANATSSLTASSTFIATTTVAWNAKAQIDGTFSSTTKIRVTADDLESASNKGTSISAPFVLDLKNPTASSGSGLPLVSVDARDSASTSSLLTLDAGDDSDGLQMCISLNDTLTNCKAYSSSATIGLAGSPDTVYVKFKDKFNNVSTVSASTPEKPSNIIIKDVSDVINGQYQELIVWKAVALPFASYEIWYKTDSNDYSFLASSTDRSANFYFHKNLDPNLTYSYKVLVKDGSGNVSYFSSPVTDKPDGNGGTNTTPPTITNVVVVSTSTDSAVITWETDQLSDSEVNYSTTNGDVLEKGVVSNSMLDNASSIGVHKIVLPGLRPGLTYYFSVKSTNIGGIPTIDNSSGANYSFDTKSGPVISDVTPSQISNHGVTVIWNTDMPSDTNIYYTTDPNFIDPAPSNKGGSENVTSHSISLTGLTPGVTYYYYVASGVATDNNAGNYFSFTTSNDLVAPVITDPSSSIITDSAAVITWTTNELANSFLQYGTVSSTYTASVSDNTLNTAHSLILSGLTSSTKYFYRVTSADASGNISTSTEYNFVTAETLSPESLVKLRELAAKAQGIQDGIASVTSTVATPLVCTGGGGGGETIDRTLPVVSAVAISDISTSSVLVNWTTDKNSYGLVEYGKDSSYGQLNGKLESTKDHQILLSRLDNGATYHYRVSSIDANGNIGKSGDDSFITLKESLPEINDKDKLMMAVSDSAKIIRDLYAKVPVSVLESALLLQSNLSHDLSGSVPPPNLSGEPNIKITSDSATLSWQTDKNSNSLVAIAPEPLYDATKGDNGYIQVSGNPDDEVTDHGVTISSLEPETVYHVQLRSMTAIGSYMHSKDLSFKTKPKELEISNYTVQTLSPEKATFRWVTSAETDSALKYTPYRGGALAVEEAKTQTDKAMTTMHEVALTDLESGVAYDVELSGKDINSKQISQKITGFMIGKDNLPPVIYQVQTDSALSIGKDSNVQTIISWLTNEMASGKVYYQKGVGGDEGNWEQVYFDPSYVKKHVAVITKFSPGTVYRFKIESADSAGNNSISNVFTVLTPRQKETVFQVIMNNFQDVFGWTNKIGK